MPRKMNFGCGLEIKPGFVNVDGQQAEGIDFSFDFDHPPFPFENDSFEYIIADNVFEHLKDPGRVLDELWRISVPGGIIHIIVPYWNAINAFNDPTHCNWFNERAIENMCGINTTYRHGLEPRYAIQSMQLKPTRPFSFLPDRFRRRLSFYVCSVIEEIDARIEVLKT